MGLRLIVRISTLFRIMRKVEKYVSMGKEIRDHAP